MAVLEIDQDHYENREWFDDVEEYKCTGCNEVLTEHYVASCGHNFCNNCKEVIKGGSQRWKCPKCDVYMRDIDGTDFRFTDKVINLRVHCPNRKSGCEYIFPFKDIKMLEPTSSIQMLKLRNEIKETREKMTKMEKRMEKRIADMEMKETVKLPPKRTIPLRQQVYNSIVKPKVSILSRINFDVDESFIDGCEDLEWIDDITAYKCRLCRKVLVEHYIATCGHKFCNECKREVDAGSQRKRCPECKDYLTGIEQQDSKFRDKVINCRVYCPNRKNGCRYTFPVKDIKDHLGKCKFTKEAAPPVLKQEGSNVEEVNVTEELQLTLTNSLEQHVNNSAINPELQHIDRVSEYYKEEADFTWIVSDVTSLTRRNPIIRRLFPGKAKELLSDEFLLKGYPFGARAMLTHYDKKVWVSLIYRDLNKTFRKKETEVKPLPKIYFTLKDQSQGAPKDLTRDIQYSLKCKFEFNTCYIIGYVAKNLVNCPSYTVDDKWMIDIYVEAPEVAQSVFSYDGTLTWAINDFQKRKQAEVDSLIWCHVSPYFYTSPNGIRAQVRAYLNGWNEYRNKGVSICLDVLDGLYDEDLKGSFVHKTTVTIFHPTQPHRNISKSQVGSYMELLNGQISIKGDVFDVGSDVEIEAFLHNNTLYYKITVEIITSILR